MSEYFTCAASGISTIIHKFNPDKEKETPSWISVSDSSSMFLIITPIVTQQVMYLF